MGSDMLPPFSLPEALGRWQFSPVVTAITVIMAALYLWGVLRVARRHPARPWPRWRTGMFLCVLLVIVLATESGVGSYDDMLFWDHMIQHLMLIMVAPPMLIAGRPVTLLMHASRNPVHTWAKRVVRSRVAAALTWPPFGIAAYTAVIVGTHLTPSFMNLVWTNESVHNAEHALYIIVGYLYLLPLVGSEPIRWRLSYPIRLIFLFIAMPVDAFTGVALGSYSRYPFILTPGMRRTWGPSPLDDVHIGGATMWIGGSAIMFVLIMVTFLAWSRAGQRADSRGWLESARRASLEDLTGPDASQAAVASASRPGRSDIDEDDEQLAAYNAFLARVNQGGQQAPH
jgi:cytochrome c oxidase assembly factor CtaG